jgi:hypothetical protein
LNGTLKFPFGAAGYHGSNRREHLRDEFNTTKYQTINKKEHHMGMNHARHRKKTNTYVCNELIA